LLRLIQDLVERHTDTEVLEACAKTLETLCCEGLAIFTRCDVARSTLIDMVVHKYREAIDEYTSLIEGVSTVLLMSIFFIKFNLYFSNTLKH
jgi:cohesin complex subunit SA-1/2